MALFFFRRGEVIRGILHEGTCSPRVSTFIHVGRGRGRGVGVGVGVAAGLGPPGGGAGGGRERAETTPCCIIVETCLMGARTIA
jgi:hypothetical protein